MYNNARSARLTRFPSVVSAFIASSKFPADVHAAFKRMADEAAIAIAEENSVCAEVDGAASVDQEVPALPVVAPSPEPPFREVYRDADQYKLEFQAALRQYAYQNPDYAKGISIDGVHNWDEVIAVATDALEKYQKAGGVRGWLRRMVHRLGKQKNTVQIWADFLPSQNEYFSVLCGGLKVIIQAAARITAIAEELANALERLPKLLDLTHSTLQIFKDYKGMHSCSATLYTAVLSSLLIMIRYLQKKSYRRAFGAVLKADDFGAEIGESMELIEKRSQEFRDCAEQCNYDTNARTKKDTTQILAESSVIRDTTEQLLKDTTQAQKDGKERQDHLLLDSKEQADRGIAEVQMVRAEVQELKETIQKLGLDEGVGRLITDFLASDGRLDVVTHNRRAEPLGQSTTEIDQYQARSLEIRSELLCDLQYNDAVINEDIRSSLRLATEPRWQAEDRAQVFMRHHKMLEWLATADSTSLFVNGNHYDSFQQPPTSFVAARVVRALQLNATSEEQDRPLSSRSFMLSFFCAHHKRPNDPDFGPAGMMRSLLAQLLAAYPAFDLAKVGRLDRIDLSDVEELSQIFERLVAQIPHRDQVVCVVDNVTTFEERKGWKTDASTAVEQLSALVEPSATPSCTFKLLLTSPITSTSLYRALPKQRVIWLPERVSSTGHLTEAALSQILGRPGVRRGQPTRSRTAKRAVGGASFASDSDEED